jgi:hypothetical protein
MEQHPQKITSSYSATYLFKKASNYSCFESSSKYLETNSCLSISAIAYSYCFLPFSVQRKIPITELQTFPIPRLIGRFWEECFGLVDGL